MDIDKIKKIIVKVIANAADVPESAVTDKALIEYDLCMDSLDFVEAVMMVEKELGIVVPDNEIENITTVKNFVDLVIEIKNN